MEEDDKTDEDVNEAVDDFVLDEVEANRALAFALATALELLDLHLKIIERRED